jgi:hypothetical protein
VWWLKLELQLKLWCPSRSVCFQLWISDELSFNLLSLKLRTHESDNWYFHDCELCIVLSWTCVFVKKVQHGCSIAKRLVTSDIAHISKRPLAHLRQVRPLSSDPVAFGVPYHRLWRAASHQHHLSLRDTLIIYLRHRLRQRPYLTLHIHPCDAEPRRM